MNGVNSVKGANDSPVTAWGALLDAVPHAAWVATLDSQRVVAANGAAAGLLGRPAPVLPGADALALCATPEDVAWWQAAAAGEASPLHSDIVLAAADGRVLHASRSLKRLPDGRHALVMLSDRGTEVRAEEARESLLAELQATLESTADGILVTDGGGRITAFNRRFAELWGLPPDPLQQKDDAALHEAMLRAVADPLAYQTRLRVLREASTAVATERLELLNGRVFERVTRPLVRAGRAQGRVWSFRDLTERLAVEEKLEAASMQDALTGLPNRRALADRVALAVADARREGSGFALLLIDLDRFRQINDNLGHDLGDRVLQTVADRILSCLRADDVLARLGGDQFAVLMQPADAGAAEATARRVLNVVAQPTTVDGAAFTLTCSIGMALGPSQGVRLDDLARHADGAMRAVKAAGRAHFRLHQARAEGDRRRHMKLDHAMRQALVSGRFRLQYQPQVNLEDGRIVGAEALLRWRDPEMGEVPPAQFIPVAEETGFIVHIGEWVLGQALRQAALWHGRGHAVPIAVNVSALQFRQPHFVDRVAGLLVLAGVPAHLLELELTESVFVHDADEALMRMHALARLGVRLSIDDFGTGFSSFAYLKRCRVGKLKIDRSFVSGVPDDGTSAEIVRAMLQMARALGLSVIAEGVETEQQRRFLHEEGCHEFQGWLYAPALDALSFEQRLAQALPAPPAAPAPPPGQRIRLVRG